MRKRLWCRATVRREAGYNLVELMLVVGIMGVLSGMAVVQMNASRPGLKGDGAMRLVLSQVRQAREMAITQRRNMRVVFDQGNRIQVIREEVPGPTLTTVSSVRIEGGLTYTVVTGVPDTPEAFGNSSSVYFGTASEVKFNPDGNLIDQLGRTLNGSVFVALSGQKLSARAVTIFGSTGRIKAFKWDGRVWVLV
jgi:prepilin-type N-terminal cleavage/methylation domain-containing protein